MVAARRANATVAVMMGAYVIKQGLSRYVIDLIRRGAVSLIAGNGACATIRVERKGNGKENETNNRYEYDSLGSMKNSCRTHNESV